MTESNFVHPQGSFTDRANRPKGQRTRDVGRIITGIAAALAVLAAAAIAYVVIQGDDAKVRELVAAQSVRVERGSADLLTSGQQIVFAEHKETHCTLRSPSGTPVQLGPKDPRVVGDGGSKVDIGTFNGEQGHWAVSCEPSEDVVIVPMSAFSMLKWIGAIAALAAALAPALIIALLVGIAIWITGSRQMSRHP